MRGAPDRTERLTLVAYVAIRAATFVVGVATHGVAYKHATLAVSITVVTAAVLVNAGVLLALALRYRWAWVLSIWLTGFGFVVFVRSSLGPLIVLESIVGLALLMSPPMRRYVAAGRHRDEASAVSRSR
jgi:hypothetical protein